MLATLQRLSQQTRIQYGLMLVFGALCILVAVAPLADPLRLTAVGTLFGFTAGLWVSHLVQVLGRAAGTDRTDVAVGD
ncbi:hypothetical protein [Haloarcula onubensis]|uniref:Uncharacterized protein n=1 Tax=Haloarcula onubensis TaxID=2950539 RepID=A0ABU2FPD5_9EURY|nr:hypothetical protein [Halomicroarcula sp. S3CR25-11]MDS0282627.1 hypothetical protein [Halomicroarcula sp. S3CR25-11]